MSVTLMFPGESIVKAKGSSKLFEVDVDVRTRHPTMDIELLVAENWIIYDC